MVNTRFAKTLLVVACLFVGPFAFAAPRERDDTTSSMVRKAKAFIKKVPVFGVIIVNEDIAIPKP